MVPCWAAASDADPVALRLHRSKSSGEYFQRQAVIPLQSLQLYCNVTRNLQASLFSSSPDLPAFGFYSVKRQKIRCRVLRVQTYSSTALLRLDSPPQPIAQFSGGSVEFPLVSFALFSGLLCFFFLVVPTLSFVLPDPFWVQIHLRATQRLILVSVKAI